LWNSGRVLGLPDFSAARDHIALKMTCEIAVAAHTDRLEQDPDEAISVVRGRIHGEDVSGQIQSEKQKAIMDWIQRIRTSFAGIVIRRTHKSIDNTGQKLFDLPPLTDALLLLELYDHEYEYLDVIADRVTSKDAVTGTRFIDGGVSPLMHLFYFTHQSFLHSHFI
jgi:hypothetical protein